MSYGKWSTTPPTKIDLCGIHRGYDTIICHRVKINAERHVEAPLFVSDVSKFKQKWKATTEEPNSPRLQRGSLHASKTTPKKTQM